MIYYTKTYLKYELERELKVYTIQCVIVVKRLENHIQYNAAQNIRIHYFPLISPHKSKSIKHKNCNGFLHKVIALLLMILIILSWVESVSKYKPISPLEKFVF